MAALVVSQVVTQPACHLGDIVGVRDQMVVGLAIGVNVPFTENQVLRLDRLAEEPAPRLMGFQIVLEPLNASGEAGRIAPGVIASAAPMSRSSSWVR